MSIGRLVAAVVSGEATLSLEWDDGWRGEVDLRTLIRDRPALERLSNAATLGAAQIASDGWSVEWPSTGIDFGAPQLRRWAEEQAGEAMSLSDFRTWLDRHKLAAAEAARALGLSSVEVDRFLTGEVAIPKTVMLATEGFDRRHALSLIHI